MLVPPDLPDVVAIPPTPLPMPVMQGSTTAVYTCPLCNPVKTCTGDASFLAHVNGSGHHKQVVNGPRVDRRCEVCEIIFPYQAAFDVHRDTDRHIRMSAFLLGVEQDFCIACHHCFTSTLADHTRGKRHVAHMAGRAATYFDGHPWVRFCSGVAIPKTDTMRAQLASPEQLRSLFPPVVDDEYKEMEMNEDDVSELDDAGDLLYDGGGGVSILVYDENGHGRYVPLETPM